MKTKTQAQLEQKTLAALYSHPITNAIPEGFNFKIQALKSDARGFRSFANDRARILFHCGKLSL